MLKKNYLFIGLILCCNFCIAQQDRIKVAGEIYYNVSHLYDTTSGSRFNETAILYYGQQGSLFRSYDAMIGEEKFKKYRAEGSIGPNPGMGRGSRDLYFTFQAVKQIQRVRNFLDGITMNTYLMPEPIEKIQWKIFPETKNIGSYNCQKALGICKGREYIAWFCADIPYNAGPWKLQGLPGLILEAVDSKNHVSFKFNRIETNAVSKDFIDPLPSFIKVKEIDFEKMRQAYYENPPANGVSGIIKNAQGEIVKPKIPYMNNPMDLISKLPKLFI
jgi:GLPGLI family protein